uniref:Uncharacterized protein n=1 Tax=Rhizophora mucronata TaxID=61149 RepID=A0A2P2QCW6_RHIMU
MRMTFFFYHLGPHCYNSTLKFCCTYIPHKESNVGFPLALLF